MIYPILRAQSIAWALSHARGVIGRGNRKKYSNRRTVIFCTLTAFNLYLAAVAFYKLLCIDILPFLKEGDSYRSG